jgi:hypothetical protein
MKFIAVNGMLRFTGKNRKEKWDKKLFVVNYEQEIPILWPYACF